jgi:ribosomal protein S18 acetylase RimI-like enzyme
MHDVRYVIGLLAGVLALAQAVPYIRSILQGKTRPSRTAYVIWVIEEAVSASSYIASGARTTMWFPIATAITAAVILVLSIRRGMGGTSRFDLACFSLAAVAITLWLTTGSALLALYMSAAAGALGYLPIFVKSHQKPWTENFTSWAMTVGSSTLNMVALSSLAIHVVVLPICSFVCSGTVTFLLWHGRHKQESDQVTVALFNGSQDDAQAIADTHLEIRKLQKQHGEARFAGERLYDSQPDLRGLPQSYFEAGGAFWVARDAAGSLAGFVGLKRTSATSGAVKRLAVIPAYRGRHVGRALIEALIEHARELGLTEITLSTGKNEKARTLIYEPLGFVVTGCDERNRDWLMRKTTSRQTLLPLL